MTGARPLADESEAISDRDLGARTRRFAIWLASASGGMPVVVFGGAEPSGDAVLLRLIGVLPEARPRDTGAPLGLLVDYAVTVAAADPLAAHAVLGEIAFLALGASDVELRDPHPDAGGGLAPALPNLVMRTTLRRPRTIVTPQRVRLPLRPVVGSAATLQGVVLGPRDMPIGGAELTIPALGLRTTTDAGGRFHFASLPPLPASILVVAKDVRLTVLARPWEKLTIRVPLEE